MWHIALHQAETKKSSKIKISHELAIVKFTKEKDGLIINRKKFHEKIDSHAFTDVVLTLTDYRLSRLAGNLLSSPP